MPQKSLTVYVVDDDESIRRALKRLLRSAGYHAVTFESAEDFMDSAPGEGHEILQGCRFELKGIAASENSYFLRVERKPGAGRGGEA